MDHSLVLQLAEDLAIVFGLITSSSAYENLLRDAGFRLSNVIPTGSPSSIMEGVPDTY